MVFEDDRVRSVVVLTSSMTASVKVAIPKSVIFILVKFLDRLKQERYSALGLDV